jgi:hypothetical protein
MLPVATSRRRRGRPGQAEADGEVRVFGHDNAVVAGGYRQERRIRGAVAVGQIERM